MEVGLRHSAKELLHNNQSFALYYLPGADKADLINGDARVLGKIPKSISSQKGFIFSPYKVSLEHPIYFIEESSQTIINPEKSFETKKGLSQEDYKEIVRKGIEAIDTNSSLSKVVLSRSLEIELGNTHNAVDLLVAIKQAMPNAFCYLVNIPQQGTWLGATPEKLLELKGKYAQTNSIAGTLPCNTSAGWSPKEIDEQQIVSDYIANHLKAIGINNYKVSGPETVSSGSVKHLSTAFNFEIEAQKQMHQLLNTLHPTPAICGMPKEEADELINELEPDTREYYAGYLGPLGMNNESHIFVNLRCMKVLGSKARLYVGAGITAGSDPEKEWQETEVKALTLLNVIRN